MLTKSPLGSRVRCLAAGLLALLALGLAACGSNSSNPAAKAARTGAAAPATTAAPSGTTSTANDIPQGPGAGDQDADNSGGPSDGDGNI